jgi:hypothetical protein
LFISVPIWSLLSFCFLFIFFIKNFRLKH